MCLLSVSIIVSYFWYNGWVEIRLNVRRLCAWAFKRRGEGALSACLLCGLAVPPVSFSLLSLPSPLTPSASLSLLSSSLPPFTIPSLPSPSPSPLLASAITTRQSLGRPSRPEGPATDEDEEWEIVEEEERRTIESLRKRAGALGGGGRGSFVG